MKNLQAKDLQIKRVKKYTATPEQLKRYIIDVYDKNSLGEWQLREQVDTGSYRLTDVIDGKVIEWTNWKREKFFELNMDFDSKTCRRCWKILQSYQEQNYIISDEILLEFMVGDSYYYIQRQNYSKEKHCYTIHDQWGEFAVNDFSYTKKGIIQRFNKYYKERAVII